MGLNYFDDFKNKRKKLLDNLGFKFVMTSLNGLSKKKLYGVLAIINNAEDNELEEANKIREKIKEIWIKRNYSLDEFNLYIKILEE